MAESVARPDILRMRAVAPFRNLAHPRLTLTRLLRSWNRRVRESYERNDRMNSPWRLAVVADGSRGFVRE